MHVDHVGLSVADLDAQRAWYAAAFGLTATEPFAIPAVGIRGCFLVGLPGIAVELLERTGSVHGDVAGSPPDALLAQGWAHLCLRVADVDAAFDRLVAAGAGIVSEPGPSPEPGCLFAFVTDPEGNFIEILDRPQGVTA